MYRQGDGAEWNYLAPIPKPPKTNKQKTNKQKLRDAKRKLTQGRRPRALHFRWKRSRLSLCLGGLVIAAWPTSDDGLWLALVQTKMVGEHYEPLSKDQKKIRSLSLRLRAALVKAEEGPRAKSAHRQRLRLDRLCRLGMFR